MLYRRIKSFSTCLTFGVVLGAFVPMASFGLNMVDEGTRATWTTTNEQKLDFDHSLTTGCIGGSLPGCQVWTNGTVGDVSSNRGTESDGGAIIMLLAKELNANGAKFCPTEIVANNRDRTISCYLVYCDYHSKRSWLRYYFAQGAKETDCFWMCKDGYFGDGCSLTYDEWTEQQGTLSKQVIKQSSFKDFGLAHKDVTGVDLPLFFRMTEQNKTISYDDGSEYNTVLGVTRFLSNGNGAFVAPIAVRSAERHENGYSYLRWQEVEVTSTPYLAVAGEETLLCKEGYVNNPGGTDCIDANSQLASSLRDAAKRAELERNAQPCFGDGQDWTHFNAAQHDKEFHPADGNALCYSYKCKDDNYVFKSTDDHSCVSCVGNMVAVSDDGMYCLSLKPCEAMYNSFDDTKHAIRKKSLASGKCYTYECKDAGYGFVSETDHTCTDCSGNAKKNHVAPNGVCIKCGSGSLYNKDKPDDGYCPSSKVISTDQLLYGKDGQRTNNVSDQCWTFSYLDEYKTCVTQGLKAAQELARQRQNSK